METLVAVFLAFVIAKSATILIGAIKEAISLNQEQEEGRKQCNPTPIWSPPWL